MASSRSDGFKSHGELVTFLFNRFVVTSLLLEMDCELFADTCVRDAVLRPFIVSFCCLCCACGSQEYEGCTCSVGSFFFLKNEFYTT